MKPIDTRKLEIVRAPIADTGRNRSAPAENWQPGFKRIFRRRNDLSELIRINPRLLRDAGIDEIELERLAIARAPLIRF